MNEARFERLAEAYGGDIARWPAEDREAAALLMAAEPDFARRVLQAAEALDAALDAFARSPASGRLTEAVLAVAPAPRRRAGWRGWMLPAGLSAGLAAACAAGVMVGVQLSQTAPDTPEATAASYVADIDLSGLSEDA